AATCRRLVRGLPVPPPPQTLSFLSWARRLAEHARSEAVRAELGFWLSGSSAAPNEPLLPADWPEGENQERLAGTVSAELSAEETQALLREVPAAYGTRIEEVLLTALGRTLAVSMGSRRIRVNLEGHGREELIEGIDLSRTVGWFTSLYPVVLEIEAEADPGAALRSVKEHLRAVPRRGIGYGLLRYLCEDPEIEARLRNQPCAEIGFNYLGQLDQALPAGSPFGFAAESTGPPRGPQGRRPHRIDVDGWIAAERLHVTWTYSTEQFRLSTVEALARQFIAELASLIGHCRSLTAGGFTPSDFPAAGLSQEELDRILSQLG
ncbi:MAG TPA: condensation domain-containing protein, partial [Thermoanaerobaculia bacterium]|nr:condensation domain-containing protein [Thermoanaerobaculia bacterium]